MADVIELPCPDEKRKSAPAPTLPSPCSDSPALQPGQLALEKPALDSWVGHLHDRNMPAEEVIRLMEADTRTPEELYAAVTRSKLKQRGFTEADVDWWVNEAKVRYCTMQETAERFGVRNNSQGNRAEGLVIPYFDADGKPVLDDGRVFERIRLFNFEGQGKYRSEYGTIPHAYLPPLPHGKSWRQIFRDTSEVIAITEGEFKAGASSMAIGGFPTIGLGGVDCFVTKHGRVPELGGINLKGRTVFIAFDAPMGARVRAGAQKALNHLVGYGAKVKVVSIESTSIYAALLEASGCGDSDEEEKPKMGLDDYLQAGGRWSDLIQSESVADLSDDSLGSQVTLLHKIAILTGTPIPSYVHLEGENLGVLRRARGMLEVCAKDTVQVPTRSGFTTKPMFDIWMQSARRIELQNVVVRPDLPPMAITPDNNWNCWKGMRTKPKRNDAHAKLFRDFVWDFFEHNVETPETIAQHRKAFMQWLADLFQNPGVRPHTSWTFISEEEGIAKSALLELPAFIIGANEGEGAFIASESNLDSEWTSFYNGKIYIVFNEPSSDNSKMRQRAKNLRTNEYLDCNTKYGAHFRIPNILTFGFTTNEPYAFGISEKARRDWVWEPKWKDTDTEWVRRTVEFARLSNGHTPDCDDFRAAVLHELLFNVDLSDYNPKAPAGNSKAKTRAAGAGASIVGSRRKNLVNDIAKLTGGWVECRGKEARAIAWTTESWEKWVGESYDKKQSEVDKKMLNGEMEKLGLLSGSERHKYRGKQDRVWFVANCLWSDLTAEQKTAAKEMGDREAGNFFDPKIGDEKGDE